MSDLKITLTSEPELPLSKAAENLVAEYGGAQFAADEWGTRGSEIKDWSQSVDDARTALEGYIASLEQVVSNTTLRRIRF